MVIEVIYRIIEYIGVYTDILAGKVNRKHFRNPLNFTQLSFINRVVILFCANTRFADSIETFVPLNSSLAAQTAQSSSYSSCGRTNGVLHYRGCTTVELFFLIPQSQSQSHSLPGEVDRSAGSTKRLGLSVHLYSIFLRGRIPPTSQEYTDANRPQAQPPDQDRTQLLAPPPAL